MEQRYVLSGSDSRALYNEFVEEDAGDGARVICRWGASCGSTTDCHSEVRSVAKLRHIPFVGQKGPGRLFRSLGRSKGRVVRI